MQNEWGVSKNEWMIKNAKLRKELVIEIVSFIPKDIYT